MELRKDFHREIRNGSLGESLSHPPSTVGLDEKRRSMVLELYYRKAGRKREGMRERERQRERRERKLERKRVRGKEERRQREKRGKREEKTKREE
jgi:hypothetical protein